MELPLAPRNPENISGKPRHGDAPLRRSPDISERSLVRNEEAPPPQAEGSLFDRVLRKKHANQIGSDSVHEMRLSASPIS